MRTQVGRKGGWEGRSESKDGIERGREGGCKVKEEGEEDSQGGKEVRIDGR